jgi:hypothetical protein
MRFSKLCFRDSFRFYGWGGSSANGTFSINEFAFNGVVTCTTLAPTIKKTVNKCVAGALS